MKARARGPTRRLRNALRMSLSGVCYANFEGETCAMRILERESHALRTASHKTLVDHQQVAVTLITARGSLTYIC
jgi:hypothetical protein